MTWEHNRTYRASFFSLPTHIYANTRRSVAPFIHPGTHPPQVVTLQRATRRQGAGAGAGADRSSAAEGSKGSCCRELVLVKEMGVCVPRAGAAKWGLFPRVVLGDTGTGPGRRQPRWDGLMPSMSGMAGQGMVVNLGHLPFRHPMEGYVPVSEMAHADAQFVLQVYDDASRMWQDVRPRYVPVRSTIYVQVIGKSADLCRRGC